MIRQLQLAVWAVRRIGLVVESAVGKGATQAFMKKQEEQCDVDALCRELIGIAPAIASEQAVTFQFAQVVSKLVQSVGFRGKLKRGQNGLVDLFGGPAADSVATMQQDFQ